MISITNLRKSYKSKTDKSFVLDIRELTIQRGEYVSIIGPDGSGKSTLIKIICGISPFESGKVCIAGYKLPEEFIKARLKIGYLSQNYTLYKNLTVYENMDYFASLFGIGGKKEKILNLLELVGLLDFKDRLSKDLSGGMKQKLSIACALIRSPEVLVLDEPTTGVDPRSRREIFSIIEEKVAQRMTVIFSTSYMDEAERAERVIIMNNGEILRDFKTENILNNNIYKSIEQFYTHIIEK
ncbi:MAG: ABC transporter ATP-binding protein [Deltaproteobacteria bacterium]|nr:ABC transporter ATP-binding protein [Deltaproteobacteria bacterium]